MSIVDRRSFLLSGLMALPEARPDHVAFGIIADVHHGFMPDAHQRLDRFLEEASHRRLDFVIQLGDFCHPVPAARPFLDSWERAGDRRYSVLGNHDMDKGSKRAILDLLKTERSYYSFDVNGFHFVVLDCNYIHENGRFISYDSGNYYIASQNRDWVDPEQVEWLRHDLRSTQLPGVVLSHQPIQSQWDLPSPSQRAAVREVLKEANERRPGSIVACFAGHEHVDDYRVFEGIRYFHINSASYYWAGEQYGGMAKYRDALYAFVSIDKSQLVLEGRASTFLPPSPAELHHPNASRVTASISGRHVRF